jgi:glycosyltransferase involved in cell wall biosynthesis
MKPTAARSTKTYHGDTPAQAASASSIEDGFASELDLSIVIPARNEAPALAQLVAELAVAFRPLQENRHSVLGGFEILIVDDGSTDGTPEVLQELQGPYPELRSIRFRWPAGQSAAMFAGFHAARGAWVGLLDADLQNPPAELARLWELLPGHDAAFGWRQRRRDKALRRSVASLANQVRRWLLRDPIRDTGCSVRIFRREMALRLPAFHGAHRFLGSLLLRQGCRIIQAPVAHRARPYGHSHYNIFNRSFNVIIDLVGVAWLLSRPIRYQLATYSWEQRSDPAIRRFEEESTVVAEPVGSPVP